MPEARLNIDLRKVKTSLILSNVFMATVWLHKNVVVVGFSLVLLTYSLLPLWLTQELLDSP